MSGDWKPGELPNLKDSDHKITSKSKINYNCFAWAAEETRRRWDPNQYYWPDGVPREVTRPAFVQAFESIGYRVCSDPTPEPGFQKIAIYLDSDGDPSHAARQLENGNWTSKVGDHQDIEHINLECMNGVGEECYGTASLYMKRPRTGRDRPPDA